MMYVGGGGGVGLVVAALLHFVAATQSHDTAVLPVLLIPGYASTQLHAWRSERCSGLGHDVAVGDRVWINLAHLIGQKECWLKCMSLRLEDQGDVSCKLRAGEGISSIAELAPGLVTGPMSIVWRNVIEALTDHFDLGPHQLMVASYDWRLPPSKLQERDHYFYTLQQKIEDAVVQNKSPGIVVLAHSLGNNVFRYFLEWLRRQFDSPAAYQTWLDSHIASYFAVGAPFLGSAESIESLTSGSSVTLPLGRESLRQLQVTFGSMQWMLPFPRAPDDPKANETLITVRFLTKAEAYTTENFTLADITNGRFHRAMQTADPRFHDLAYLYDQYYTNDPVLNPHSPWERPPIKSVYIVYGTGLPVSPFLRYEHSSSIGRWELTSVMGEGPDPTTCFKTGDGTVGYDSLSWGHTWLGQKGDSIRVTRIPQAPFFTDDDVSTTHSTRLEYSSYTHDQPQHGGVCVAPSKQPQNATSTGGRRGFLSDMMWSGEPDPSITFYEYTDTRTHTSVWELDRVQHREILSHPAFLRELKHELQQAFATGRAHASKSFRPPHHDSDCYWNYLGAQCAYSEYCQYDYKFGDVTLDQSCRIKTTNTGGPTETNDRGPQDAHQGVYPPTGPQSLMGEPLFKHILSDYTSQCGTHKAHDRMAP
ncbi:hypothetical protein H310_10248 [Aphanomyces invadans]|uniref:Uncharacterized protein n=1 Tax=Aphanomyces invadans TaxID=157072 RepID=A0A024TTA0_9STRA|nr:hypothetical protein H310_10248 [Aphanomyces invadans]ETV96537.1 hypothetical protein H310_10248 [Aphanomyces invadans]|eukprot:XP_008874800.1 hypothetical protein H310_10248 [Aphanomyces invadans]